MDHRRETLKLSLLHTAITLVDPTVEVLWIKGAFLAILIREAITLAIRGGHIILLELIIVFTQEEAPIAREEAWT
jgi:hypothetical protein